MDVTEKYGGTGHFDYALKIKIREAIFNTTDEEINAYTDMLNSEIRKLGIGGKINNTLEYRHSFDCNGKIEDYLISGANEIVSYAKKIHLKQIALFQLMNAGVLMPISLQANTKIELNLNHSHGNKLFDLVMDVLPYNQFLIIQMPIENMVI